MVSLLKEQSVSPKLTQTLSIIGKGRAGSAFAAAIRLLGDDQNNSTSGYTLHSHLAGRPHDFSAERSMLESGGGPEILVLAVMDSAISEVALRAMAAEIPNLRIVVSLSGAFSPMELPNRTGIARLTLHPLQTLTTATESQQSPSFEGITFAAASESTDAINWAREFARALGAADLLVLEPAQLPLYHAMVVLASNTITLLGSTIEQLSPLLGLAPNATKAALAPLMRKTLENVLDHAASEVLTGPFSRNDTATIAKHREALGVANPSILLLYVAIHAYAESWKSTMIDSERG